MNNNRSFNGTRYEWYFFSPRERKYAKGKRPNRQAGDGFWKATGADSPIKDHGKVIGSRRNLVYHRGKPPGHKTNWLMQEYVLPEDPGRNKDMQLNDWVLCRVYQRPETEKEKHQEGYGESETETQTMENGVLCRVYQRPETEKEKHREGHDGETETQTMENGVPALDDGSSQWDEFEDMLNNTLTDAEPDPLYNEYGDYNGELQQFSEQNFAMSGQHEASISDYGDYNGELQQFPQQNSTMSGHHQASVSDYGNFMLPAAPLSSLPPFNDQVFSMNDVNFNQYDQPPQPLSQMLPYQPNQSLSQVPPFSQTLSYQPNQPSSQVPPYSEMLPYQSNQLLPQVPPYSEMLPYQSNQLLPQVLPNQSHQPLPQMPPYQPNQPFSQVSLYQSHQPLLQVPPNKPHNQLGHTDDCGVN